MNLGKWTGLFVAVLAAALFLFGAAAQQDKNAKGSGVAASQKGGEAKEAGTASVKGDAAMGGKIFGENCVVCHDANSDTVKIGPGLKGLFKKHPHKASNGKDHSHTVATIREQIEKGSGSMPPMGKTL